MTVKAIPDGPRIIPYLLYRDVGTAIDWLAAAFGLSEFGERFVGPDGSVQHGAMTLGDGMIMMGCPGSDYKNPEALGHVTQHLYLYVEDIDAHFGQAKAAGARILQEPADMFYGDRTYCAQDPEGHQWYFAQHVRDVAPEDMKPSE